MGEIWPYLNVLKTSTTQFCCVIFHAGIAIIQPANVSKQDSDAWIIPKSTICISFDDSLVLFLYYSDVIMRKIVSQITGVSIGCSTVCQKNPPKLRVTGLCEGNSPVTGELPTQRASNAEMFPFDDVIMMSEVNNHNAQSSLALRPNGSRARSNCHAVLPVCLVQVHQKANTSHVETKKCYDKLLAI